MQNIGLSAIPVFKDLILNNIKNSYNWYTV